jgi:hypothetical protein
MSDGSPLQIHTGICQWNRQWVLVTQPLADRWNDYQRNGTHRTDDGAPEINGLLMRAPPNELNRLRPKLRADHFCGCRRRSVELWCGSAQSRDCAVCRKLRVCLTQKGDGCEVASIRTRLATNTLRQATGVSIGVVTFQSCGGLLVRSCWRSRAASLR